MTADRPHAPSSQRIAEARARGHLPRTPLAGMASALVALTACAFWLGPRIAGDLRALFAEPLMQAASGQLASANTLVLRLVRNLFESLSLAALASVVAVALGLWLAQGPSFWRRASDRTSFAPLRLSRTASGLFVLGLLALALHALFRWTELESSTLSTFARELASSLCVLTLACAVIDVAFARARWFTSLFMTRRELLLEQREAFGAPEVRAARARARKADA